MSVIGNLGYFGSWLENNPMNKPGKVWTKTSFCLSTTWVGLLAGAVSGRLFAPWRSGDSSPSASELGLLILPTAFFGPSATSIANNFSLSRKYVQSAKVRGYWQATNHPCCFGDDATLHRGRNRQSVKDCQEVASCILNDRRGEYLIFFFCSLLLQRSNLGHHHA